MAVRTILRISPAAWLGPILALVAMGYARIIYPATYDPYPLALTSVAGWTVSVIGPTVAAFGAWEGGRLHRAGWWGLPHARPAVVVAGASLAPVLVAGLGALGAAIAIRFADAGVLAWPDLRVVGVETCVVTAQALLGFAIGLRLRPVVAVPAAFLLMFTWMALPAAILPVWLDFPTGAWAGCCAIDSDLAPRAVASAITVVVGFLLAALVLLQQPFARIQFGLASLAAALGIATGLWLVRGMDSNPTVPRDPSVLVCAPGPPQVCVWPEHRSRLATAARVVAKVAPVWQAAGVPLPARFSEEWSESLPSSTGRVIIRSDNEEEIVLSLARGVLPPVPPCALKSEVPYFGFESRDYVIAWLVDVAGVPPDRYASTHVHGDKILRTVASVRALPPDEQRAWLAGNLAAMRACGVRPPLEPTK